MRLRLAHLVILKKEIVKLKNDKTAVKNDSSHRYYHVFLKKIKQVKKLHFIQRKERIIRGVLCGWKKKGGETLR